MSGHEDAFQWQAPRFIRDMQLEHLRQMPHAPHGMLIVAILSEYIMVTVLLLLLCPLLWFPAVVGTVFVLAGFVQATGLQWLHVSTHALLDACMDTV